MYGKLTVRIVGSQPCRVSFPQVPEKKLKVVMADKELYKVCAVEVKRQIWQDNQALFGDEVSPLLKQYIVEKEAALFSNDLSILHNFFSPSPKTRRQGEVSLRRPRDRNEPRGGLEGRWALTSTLDRSSTGGPQADPDDWEECEALRHGPAVPEDPLSADAERPLLHTACRAADVPPRPGHQRDLLRRPLPQGTTETNKRTLKQLSCCQSNRHFNLSPFTCLGFVSSPGA